MFGWGTGRSGERVSKVVGEQREKQVDLPVPGADLEEHGAGIPAILPGVNEGLEGCGRSYEAGLNAEFARQAVDICPELLPELPAFWAVAFPRTWLRNAV